MLDKLPNQFIRGSLKIARIEQKIQESRLRWKPESDTSMRKNVLNIATAPEAKLTTTYMNEANRK